jgi:Ca-activated chloride channel family protein
MVAIASRARATFAIAAAAGATLAAALALHPEAAPAAAPGPREYADDGFRLAVREVGDHAVVTIAAPAAEAPVRPRSVVVAIDRSRSMTGAPLAQAKRAAARLVAGLGAGDAFAIVAYSDQQATVVPMMTATAVHKELAYRAIDELVPDNGTCISCGITSAAEWLARTPVERGIRRIVLISDGRPLLGLRDPDDLAQLASDTAARGISISTVGVGDDFEAQLLMRLAAVGRGAYHGGEGAAALDEAFDREAAGLSRTVATSVGLTLEAAPGVELGGALGQPAVVAGGKVFVPIADMQAGEVRKVVLRLARSTEGQAAAGGVSARLGWLRAADGVARGALALSRPVDADDASEDAADGRALVEEALASVVLERAAREGDAAAARQLLREHAERIDARRDLSGLARDNIGSELGDTANAFDDAANGGRDLAAVRKLAHERAHILAR